MDVSIIIPVYNHIELTRECINSLTETTKGADYEVIIVDDGSEKETSAGLKKLASETIKVVQSPRNQGYAHANNLGALYATGKHLVLANNDLIFLPGWLPPMLAAYDKLKKVGLVGNVQLNAKTGEVDHAGVYVSPDTTIEHKRTLNRGFLRRPPYTRVHLITAACCVIPRKLFIDIGGFDEAFLNGGEDIDLCYRLKNRGYRVTVANQSVVKHQVSTTRSGRNVNTEINSRYVQRKWKNQLAQQAASHWPDTYLASNANPILWPTIDLKLLRDALFRYLMITKGPSQTALSVANCELERKERHWKSILDGWSDEKIKLEERKMYSSPLNDGYQYSGFHPVRSKTGVWIRESGEISLPRGTLISTISFAGSLVTPSPSYPEEKGELGLAIKVNDSIVKTYYPIPEGSFSIEFPTPPVRASEIARIVISLLGVQRSNTYAYLGRKMANNFLIPKRFRQFLGKYRAQRLNHRLCLEAVKVNGEDVFNFALDPTSPLNTDYAIRHANLGINLVGWFKAELGIGESARLSAKALKALDVPHAIVPLKVNCLSSQGDCSLDKEFSDSNPYPVNLFHIDAPQSADIDHHHGPSFRKGKRNIAYWAWELPEFPDRWIKYFKYFDEVWTPSNFVRDAIALKSPVPVITVPHCIDFTIPNRDWRAELKLPKDRFLFCFAYDLNSYQERKNPRAVIDAYRLAFGGSNSTAEVGLVIKIHSTKNNQEQYGELLELLKGIPNYYLIDQTLSREYTYGLMQACDSYVSLHRSEGFGLTVAESMFLGKPVISTNWSATSEFVNASNACPVNFTLTKLIQDFGPYDKGQLWADPDTSDAAEHMKRLASDPELAKALGRNARQTIVDLYSPNRIAGIYRNRLRALALW